MKLLMKMIMIACAHVGVFFLLYARQNVLLGYFRGWTFPLCLLLPSCVAGYLNYAALSSAALVSAHHGRARLAAWAIAATCLSLYCGVFLSLNIYGE
jgi:hypothetical protein